MITRQNIVELAEFESPTHGAVSFYFQPDTPQNKSHRQETIAVKDMVRNALHDAGKNGKSHTAREDLERILAMTEHLRGTRRLAKAIFACSEQNFWREYDLPAQLTGKSLTVGQAFSATPLHGYCRGAASRLHRPGGPHYGPHV